LRDFYPGALEAFGADLYEAHSLALLEWAPTPTQGRALSLAKITSALHSSGRRNVQQRAVAIRDALRAPQLEQPAVVAQAHEVAAVALAGVLQGVIARLHQLEKELGISLKRTRTPRSTSVCQDLRRSSAPGHWRILANRLVGILHCCLRHRQLYGEDIAWPLEELAAA